MSAVTVNVTILDAKGKSSITKIRVPTGFVLPQYAEFGVAMGQLIANLNEGVITEVSVSIPVDLSTATIRAAAMSVADVAKKLLVIARSSVVGLLGKFNIPTYDEINTVSGSDQADLADPGIAAFVALVESGVNVSGTFIQPVDLRGNDLEDVSQAREIFRKYG